MRKKYLTKEEDVLDVGRPSGSPDSWVVQKLSGFCRWIVVISEAHQFEGSSDELSRVMVWLEWAEVESLGR